MDEIHKMPYSAHLGYQKTIATFRKQYFWPRTKKNIIGYIFKCMKCQQVKVEHQHLEGFLRLFPIPEWKWEIISMDFIIGFPMTVKQHVSIMLVVDKLSKYALFYTS